MVGVPNLASVQARIGGERWYHLDVPRHRTHFTPAGLARVLERSGLAPVAVHHLLLEHNPYGMWQSAVNRLSRDPSYVYNLLKRNAPPASREWHAGRHHRRAGPAAVTRVSVSKAAPGRQLP